MASHNQINGNKSEINPEKMIRFYHKWVRHHFSLSGLGEVYKFDKISSGNPDFDDEWELTYRLEANSYTINNRPLIISLCLEKCLGEKILARCELTIVGAKNEILKESTDKRYCKNYKPGDVVLNWTIPEDFLYPRSISYVPNDTLTIVCEIVMLPSPEKFITNIEPDIKTIHLSRSHYSDDMQSLFNHTEFSDFTFKFGDRELRAIKGILSARSSVFAAMFSNKDFRENQKNYADIEDIDYEVFREMLFFIYTDRAPNLDEMAGRLLAAADKYMLERLITMCEKFIHKNISTDSALSIFILSDKYRSNQLRTQALEYIGLHKKEILKSKEFDLLMKSNYKQAKAILDAVVDQEDFISKSKKLKT